MLLHLVGEKAGSLAAGPGLADGERASVRSKRAEAGDHLFALACAGLVLLPGPVLIFIVTRGVVHSRRLAQTSGVIYLGLGAVAALSHGPTTKS